MGRPFPNWFRYGIPAVFFSLGTWQVYRLNRKQDLIRDLERGLSRVALKLDTLPADLESLRFRRLKLYGTPNRMSPIFLGPRGARDLDVDFAMSFILPFQMADGTVLVDYGRVPRGKEGEIRLEEEPYVEVMLDRGEKKSIAVQENNPDEGRWSYRNIEQMAKHYKCQPILFRRISRRTGEIPIAGPPQIELPNRHFEYIVTWYLMSAATFALGFLRR